MPQSLITEEWWAQAYGFPPQVVEEMPIEAFHCFPVIRAARAKAAALHDKVNAPRRG